MKNAENDEKHSMIWGMFMSVALESAVFMGKNYSDKCHSITNTRDLTLKPMFDISEKFVRGVSWSHVTTVPKRKSHRVLDLDLSLNTEVNIWKGRKENGGTK